MDQALARREPRLRVALLARSGERLLLVRQAKAGRSYWLAPGGGVDWGESLPAALRRELAEELGLQVPVIGPLLFCHDSIDPKGGRHVVNLYFAGEIAGEPCPADPAVGDWGWFDAAALAGLPMQPPVNETLRAYLAGASLADPYIGSLWRP